MTEIKSSRYINGVLFGTGILAFSIFLMLAILHRHLNVQQYADFATFWSITSGVIAGINAPLETTGVALSRSDKRIFKSDVRKLEFLAFRQDLVLIIGIIVAAVAVSDELPVRYESLLLCLAIVLVGYTYTYCGRGFLVAKGSTGIYGSLMAIEGILRVAIISGIFYYWRLTAVTAALAVSLSALTSGLLHRYVVHSKAVYELKETSKISRRQLTLLTLSSMSFLGLANAEPVAAYFLGDDAGTGDILNALTLARSPLLFVAVLQALVIPTVIHNTAEVKKSPSPMNLRKIVTASAILLGIYSLLFALVGNQIINTLYGGSSALSEIYLLLLVLTPGCLLVAVIAQSILIVVKDFEWITGIWFTGIAFFVLGLLIPISPVSRIILSGFISGVGLVGLFVARTYYLIKTRRL